MKSYDNLRNQFLYTALPGGVLAAGTVYFKNLKQNPTILSAKALSDLSEVRARILDEIKKVDTKNLANQTLSQQFSQGGVSINELEFLQKKFSAAHALQDAILSGKSYAEVYKKFGQFNKTQSNSIINANITRYAKAYRSLMANHKGIKALILNPDFMQKLGWTPEKASQLVHGTSPEKWIEAIFSIEKSKTRPIPPEWYTKMIRQIEQIQKLKVLSKAVLAFTVITTIPYFLMEIARHHQRNSN